jgi:hypothetical protein
MVLSLTAEAANKMERSNGGEAGLVRTHLCGGFDAGVGCLAGALLRLNLSVRRACFFSSRCTSEIAAN